MEKQYPDTWVMANFADLVDEIESGKRPKGGVRGISQGVPSLGGEHLTWAGGFNFENMRFVPKDFADAMAKGHIEPEDILIVKDGATTSKTSFVGKSFLFDDAVINEHVFRLRINKWIKSKYVFYFLWSREGRNSILEDFRGAAQGGISSSFISKVELPLSPEKEQQRIVAKIEQLFSELNAGVESLKTAREQLGGYRQALLKKAFEGKLTEKWRAANPDKLESVGALLTRIRKEREARYQQQLADWKSAVSNWEAEGKTSKKPTKPRKLKPVEPLNTKELAELHELPEGWMWLRLAGATIEISDGPFGSNLKTSDYVAEGVRVVRLENIGHGLFISEKESFVSEEKYRSISKYTVYPGDLVFSSFINDAVRATIIPTSIEKAVNKADCFCVRLYGESVTNRYLEQCFMARYFFKYLESRVHGFGRPRINTTQLGETPIPLCSLLEQHEIVRILEEQFTAIEQNEQEIDAALQRAEALRHSILKKAFSGKLVPQDSNDEPASVLLERIRNEREAKPKTKPKRKNRRRQAFG